MTFYQITLVTESDESLSYYNLVKNTKDWDEPNIAAIEISLRQTVDSENRKA